jgi:hypothetical protein
MDYFEQGKESADSLKGAEFFDYLSDCQFLKKTMLIGVNGWKVHVHVICTLTL